MKLVGGVGARHLIGERAEPVAGRRSASTLP
jgi:hypothetical protein